MVVPLIALIVVVAIVAVVIYNGIKKKKQGKRMGEPGKKL